MRSLLLFAVTLVSGPALGQTFECRMGQNAACLDWGETVCTSQGMCVDKNAACFESYQCDYRGFACKSAVDECVEAHDRLASDYNALLSDYETLRTASQELAESHDELQRDLKRLRDCLTFASTIEDAQICGY
ncbi:hypothetical protein [Tabrizicola aquatica]|uniref:hypothetical protein n=1 Tax=Tabrizicola aquatica TaxID=909926 RepID=UPI001CA53225|nr:hypothetical protein [Tabrizicola aquatica]